MLYADHDKRDTDGIPLAYLVALTCSASISISNSMDKYGAALRLAIWTKPLGSPDATSTLWGK
jgi:hypothetical protein